MFSFNLQYNDCYKIFDNNKLFTPAAHVSWPKRKWVLEQGLWVIQWLLFQQHQMEYFLRLLPSSQTVAARQWPSQPTKNNSSLVAE